MIKMLAHSRSLVVALALSAMFLAVFIPGASAVKVKRTFPRGKRAQAIMLGVAALSPAAPAVDAASFTPDHVNSKLVLRTNPNGLNSDGKMTYDTRVLQKVGQHLKVSPDWGSAIIPTGEGKNTVLFEPDVQELQFVEPYPYETIEEYNQRRLRNMVTPVMPFTDDPVMLHEVRDPMDRIALQLARLKEFAPAAAIRRVLLGEEREVK